MNQQRRYFAKAGQTDCPQTILLEDLHSLLQEWHQNGERIVAFIDSNENMSDGFFNSLFTHPDLGMKEAVTSCHPNPRWKYTGTYCKGESVGPCPIDGVYMTADLPINATTWLQFIDALGDHRFAVLDVKAMALVGDHPLWIVQPPAR